MNAAGASATKKILLLLFTTISTALLSVPATAQEQFTSDWAPREDSQLWFDARNWSNGVVPGGPGATANIGSGTPAFFTTSSVSGGILLLNIGDNAELNITNGGLSFGPRGFNQPFSVQNSGILNITGSSAQIQLRDQVANFSPASINLDDGGRINIINGDTTINTSDLDTGNGLITMGTGSRITGSGGATLTFEKQTIEGQGNIGNNSIGLRFGADTIVDANSGGDTLTVDAINSLNTANEGVMRATNGGILSLRGPIDNTGGLIEAQDGSEVALGDTFDITGGILRRSGTGTFTSSGSGRLSNLTIDVATLDVVAGGGLSLNGLIDNQSDITILNPGNQFTDLVIDGATRLEGEGTITLAGPNTNFSRITGVGDGVLTNVDNTIQGAGRAGNGLVRIVNEADGTINANAIGQSLTLGPVAGSALVNRGRLIASNGGTLVFGAGQYDNANGLIDLQDSSAISLSNGTTITGGIFRDFGDITSTVTSTLQDLTVEGNLEIANGNGLGLDGTINNLGDITALNPGNQFTDLVIDGATRLEGEGTITLAGPNTNFSRITGGGDGVLTNVDNTIQGAGRVGNGSVRIINESGGTITGNDADGTLSLDVSAASASINRGLITSSDSGALSFTSGGFDNSDGRIEAGEDGTVTVGGTATVNGGLFNAANGGTIKISGSGSISNALLQSSGTGNYQVDSGRGSLVDSTNQSSITVSGGAGLELDGTINNLGDITALNPGNQFTDLVIDGATRLEGEGTITLAGPNTNFSRITGAGDGVLTNVGNTIQGAGQVGNGLVQITNEAGGTIDANASDQSLTLGPVTGNALVNRGRLTASSDGNLVLGAGEYDNANGLIDVQSESTISLSSANITGGIFRDLGNVRSNRASTLTDLTVEGDLVVEFGDGLGLDGTINNVGSITALNPGNQFTDLVIDGATRLEGEGTITLAGLNTNFSRITGGGDGVLTNVDNTIQGAGRVGNGLVQIINESGGTITGNDADGTLSLDVSAASASINRGLITSSDSGALSFTSGGFDNSDGRIEAGDDGTVTVGGTATVNGGLFNAANGGTIKISGSGSISNALLQSSGTGNYQVDSGRGSLVDSTNESSITVLGGAGLELDGTINNLGDITALNPGNQFADLVINGSTRLEGEGTITLAGDNATLSRITGGGSGVLVNVDNTIQGRGRVGNGLVEIANQTGGAIHANQSGIVLAVNSSGDTLQNAGTLLASDGGILSVADAIVNNTGTLDVQADSEIRLIDLLNEEGGRLVGDGTLIANNVLNEGILAPGNSPGFLSIEGDVTLGATSDLQIELASLTDFDLLDVDGTTTLGGDLSLFLLDGYRPDQLDVFDVLTSTSLDGSFFNVGDGDLLQTSDGLGSFTVSYSGNSVRLSNFTAAAVPEPSSVTVVLICGAIGLMRRRRQIC